MTWNWNIFLFQNFMVSCTWKRSACSLKASSVASSPTVELFFFFLLRFKRSWKNQMMLLPKIEGPHALDPLPLIITLLYFLFVLEITSALTLLSSCLICFPFTNLSFPLSFLSQLLLKPFLLPLFSVLSERWFSWHYEQCLFLQEKHFLLYIVFPFSSGPAYPKDVLVFFLF